MGVDYYTCAKCSDNFPDCGHYAFCEVCENFFCSDDCASLKPIDEDDEDNTNCCICRKEFVTDDDLLYFLLKHCNLTKEDAINLYKRKK